MFRLLAVKKGQESWLTRLYFSLKLQEPERVVYWKDLNPKDLDSLKGKTLLLTLDDSNNFMHDSPELRVFECLVSQERHRQLDIIYPYWGNPILWLSTRLRYSSSYVSRFHSPSYLSTVDLSIGTRYIETITNTRVLRTASGKLFAVGLDTTNEMRVMEIKE